MKVSIKWLKQLVDLNASTEELITLIPMRTIGFKETTDDYLELDMKGYNRADLLSMRGVAREVAAITDSKITFEDPNKLTTDLPETPVKVESPDLAQVYCVAKIEGLKVGSSNPDWVKKLADSGIRSINNVADTTNLIMLEFGQPMHAFDAAKVKDETLIVRTANSDEKLTTLDGKVRPLNAEDLLITDPEKALGLAGVMGGKDSEISDSTNTILLEAAIFDPINIRKTVQRHNLPSEAAKRFQHGLTKDNLLQALSAAIKMYEDLGGKVTAISLTGGLKDRPKTVALRHAKVNSLIGIDLTKQQIEQSLQSLGFHLEGVGINSWNVTAPYWRLDINIEEDLIEEIARIYGYEKIPAKELKGDLPEKIDQSLPNQIYDTKKALADAGLTEVQTYSFYSTMVLKSSNYDKNELIKVANPISSETEYLRNHLWPNLVEVVGKNMRNGYKDIAIFEVGKTYQPTKTGHQEEYRLSLALMNGTDNPVAELYQILESVKLLELKLGEEIGESSGRFHPTRYVYLTYKDKPVGKIGEVHPRILNGLGIARGVAILEVDLEGLIRHD